MLLTIDVGNTNMVFGIFQGEYLMGTFRLQTNHNSTADEIGLMATTYLQRYKLEPRNMRDIIISSVVPQMTRILIEAITEYFNRMPYVIDGNIDPDLPYGVESNERLGPDRAVADIAAMRKYGAPLVVLDFGTATTIDTLSQEGAYLGGCITAGVRVAAEALFQRTAMLPHIDLTVPEKVLSGTAVGQIQGGAMMGYVGSMEYLIRRAKEEMGYPPEKIRVVATGGLASVIASHTDAIDIVDDTLILDGLYYIYYREKRREREEEKEKAKAKAKEKENEDT